MQHKQMTAKTGFDPRGVPVSCAFGLEENRDFAEAEEMGRLALTIRPDLA